MSPCFAVFVSSELFLFAHDMGSDYLSDTAVTWWFNIFASFAVGIWTVWRWKI